jgi:hypothetical protein
MEEGGSGSTMSGWKVIIAIDATLGNANRLTFGWNLCGEDSQPRARTEPLLFLFGDVDRALLRLADEPNYAPEFNCLKLCVDLTLRAWKYSTMFIISSLRVERGACCSTQSGAGPLHESAASHRGASRKSAAFITPCGGHRR